MIILSEEQQSVIAHRGSDLQVIACAGSGKTESISRRVAALVEEGAEPASIVAFTFTERAAAELKERIIRRVAERMGKEFRDRLGPMFVGTIHGYCFRLLQDYVPRYGNYDVLDENRHAGFLSRHYYDLGLSNLGPRHWQPIRDFAQTVDVIGNELISADDLDDDTPLAECYRAYLGLLDRFHFLTFSRLIACAVEALDDPRILDRVRAPLRHLLVDEYQDINPAQEALIRLLAAPPVELCVVGDDDQSIYQWRGSDVDNIITFTSRRNARPANLGINRRSRPEIVQTADRFARSIPGRLEKEMKPHRRPGEHEVIPWRAATDVAEAATIADTIERIHETGYQYREIAVLFRSVRTAAGPLLDELDRRGIPYACGGRTGLFMQPEIAFFGEIFAWFVDADWQIERWGQRRPASIDHIAGGLTRIFPRVDEGVLRLYLEDWKAFHMRGQRSVSLVGDFYKLLALLGASEIDIDTPEGSGRLGAYARFSEILGDYEHIHRRGHVTRDGEGDPQFHSGRDRGKPYFKGLFSYLQHWARDAYEDFAGEETLDVDAVDVLTVHQAKGLEWPVVFLPSLVEGRFPSRRAGEPQNWLLPETVFPPETRARYEGSDAEERRLFYVAMTRARDCLYVSGFDRKTNRFRISPYLLEMTDGAVPLRDSLPLPARPDGERVKQPPPVEISFSELALADECGHAYRLGTVYGFQQELAVELGYGKAIHHVLRQLAETVKDSGEIPSRDALRDLIDDELYVPFASQPAWKQMHQAATRLVKRYIDSYADDLKRVWEVERPFALHLDEGVVTGRADVILDEEGGTRGRLALVDYKVAEDPHREERYRLQLAVYAQAGRGEGLEVEAAYLHELRDGKRNAVDIGPEKTGAAMLRMKDLLRRTRAGDLKPNAAPHRCGGCSYQKICAHASK